MSARPIVTAATRLLAILGEPVAHSLSPVLHNAALQALHLDGVYVALSCSAADCPGLLRGVAQAGGGGNVTLPHKEIAARTIERPSALVKRTGACNTYWLEKGQICGDNTDVEGFQRAVQSAFGDLAGAHVLVLGAGGAARAVLAALADARAARVSLLARTPARAEQLAFILAGSATRIQPAVAGASDPVDLVVNATPLGLHDHDPEPFPLDRLRPGTLVFDLVYHPQETAWVRAARAAGLRAADGKEMLLQQAAASFRRWWRCDPPIDVMRETLDSTRRG